MKKNVLIVIFILCLLVLPIKTEALKYKGVDYKTLNLDEALTEEEIEHDFSNYKESDKQVTIYLFRGKGCAYCRAFLTHLNDIVDDMGKYFKVVSFEVWNDANNAELMDEVNEFLNAKANGIPFYIIGDKTFVGYGESYDEDIKAAIMDAYNSKDKYDVFKEMNKPLPKEISNSTVLIWTIVLIVISTTIIVTVTSVEYSLNKKKLINIEKALGITEKTTTDFDITADLEELKEVKEDKKKNNNSKKANKKTNPKARR